jgi:hypothetical protein
MSQQGKTNDALSQIQRLLPELDAEPLPEVVYHYTDTAGLLGIVRSGTLWATDYRFLNDSSEVSYIFRLAAEVVRDEFVGHYSGLAGAFLDFAATASPPYSDVPYYLCCFSALDNSLSQWRAYGGRQGFSLAFPGDVTPAAGYAPDGKQNPGLTLLKVNYQQLQQKAYISALLRALVELCETPHMKSYNSEDEAIASFSPFYWGQLERASYRFKHPDFEVEQEWRLVAWGSVHEEYFRAGSTITPYTPFRLFSQSQRNSFGDGLPLTAVRHGPSNLAGPTIEALDRLLNAHGYGERSCQRLGSSTPVRL